jgi:methyl-accepting chemotaxis protein
MKNSISFKFNLLTSIMVIAILLGFGAYNYSATDATLKAQQNKQVDAVIHRLQTSVPSTLWNFEAEQLKSIVESETSNDAVLGIFIYDDKKLILGRLKSDTGTISDAKLPENLKSMREEKLTYEENGKLNVVGRIVLLIDSSVIDELQNQSLQRLILQTVTMLVGLIVMISILMKSVVAIPIERIITALEDIARGEGDLTRRLNTDRNDEIGTLAKVFNQFVEKIQTLICRIQKSVVEMSVATGEMSQIARASSHAVDEQRTETDQVATAMNELNATAHEVAQNAVQAAAAAEKADDTGQMARDVVRSAITSIHQLASDIDSSSRVISELEKEVANITSVLDVIRGIAEQTNLLALNAAIEAARAGEQGRGFAVVADEVRTLASKTQASTEEIQEMIRRLQNGTNKAVSVMQSSKSSGEATVGMANKADAALNDIAASISMINEMNTQIASAAEEQTAVTDDINRSLTRIVEIADGSAEGARRAENASAQLANLGSSLDEQVKLFKV